MKAAFSGAQQVARGVHRIADAAVNCYAIEEDSGLLLVDCLWPGSAAALTAGLGRSGFAPSDVRAVVLTHGDPDHLGLATWLSEQHGAAIFAHPAELDLVQGRRDPTPSGPLLANIWRPSSLGFVAGAIRRGAKKVKWPQAVEAERLPTGLLGIFCPGHTEGHCAYLHEPSGALFTGDALLTRNVITGQPGPQLHPITFDRRQAVASLDDLSTVDADVLLPGHGEPWRGGTSEAVAKARVRG